MSVTIECTCGQTFTGQTGISTAGQGQRFHSHPVCPHCGAGWVVDVESGRHWPKNEPSDEEA